MTRKLLYLAGLVLASTAHAQTPDRALYRYIGLSYETEGTPSSMTAGRVDATPVLRINGQRALLSRVEGAGARSSFRAEVRGDVTSNASGAAEFGAVNGTHGSSGAFVISLGICSDQSAILFTRRSGTPLDVGRYRISADANGADEILALVLTGPVTRPTGAYRGLSGWLVVTAASDRLLAGRFEVDAIGFRAAEPERENRPVHVTGSFSATTASSSFQVCEAAE